MSTLIQNLPNIQEGSQYGPPQPIHQSNQPQPQQQIPGAQTHQENSFPSISDPIQYNPNDIPSSMPNNQQSNIPQNVKIPNPHQNNIPQPNNNIQQQLQTAHNQNQTHLQSRDIPMDQSKLVADPEIHHDYIEKKKVKNSRKKIEELLKKYENNDESEKQNRTIIDDIQIPLLITIIFFIFQLPFMNNMFKRLMPSLFRTDGNMTSSSIIVKSLAFGAVYFIISLLIEYMSEL